MSEIRTDLMLLDRAESLAVLASKVTRKTWTGLDVLEAVLPQALDWFEITIGSRSEIGVTSPCKKYPQGSLNEHPPK
jgi:hypothetical protein